MVLYSIALLHSFPVFSFSFIVLLHYMYEMLCFTAVIAYK